MTSIVGKQDIGATAGAGTPAASRLTSPAGDKSPPAAGSLAFVLEREKSANGARVAAGAGDEAQRRLLILSKAGVAPPAPHGILVDAEFRALNPPVVNKGTPTPRYKEENGSDERMPSWMRTLRVSSGWPNATPTAPENDPAQKASTEAPLVDVPSTGIPTKREGPFLDVEKRGAVPRRRKARGRSST
eukprot:CAMPEP_0184192922 /NCGR_PEP_ID=MMETSP0976-20121227/3723_1 /TAXON_ID=483370 /ORGANISM="non described non described, Strain CCMP2097" /LENGTH=187 /DNA_ID=CAMNT_0026497329 /DNA_START=430 /DNA_END=996 /DNA_ORIENTATION=-